MTFDNIDERHLELKVGAMILVAIALLVTFVLILGDFSFKSRKAIAVYFENPGGLSPGAPVKVAGRNVGKITEMTFLGQSGPMDPVTRKPALIKVVVEVDEAAHTAIRSDVRFYVTTKGMLGDPFMEIDPGVSKSPYNEKTPLFGVNPPRLDLFIADTYQLIRGLNSLIDRNAENLDLLLGGGAKLLGVLDKAIEADGGIEMKKLDKIVDNMDGLVQDARDLVAGVNERYVQDPTISRTFANMEALSAKLNNEVSPLLAEIRQALKTFESLADTLGPEEKRRIKSAIAKLDDLSGRTTKLIGRADKIMADIESGKGTVGQMLQDQEIYDDIKELIRDIKRHPWKLIWED